MGATIKGDLKLINRVTEVLVEHSDILEELNLTGRKRIMASTLKFAGELANEKEVEHAASCLALVLDYYASRHGRDTARYAASQVGSYLERWFAHDDDRIEGREDA